jgi:hypothetical protein
MSEVVANPRLDGAVFTVCNLAYLPKALVLARSLLKFNECKLKIFLFDRKIDVQLPTELAEFIWIEDLAIDHFAEYAFKYDITEFSTSLKPLLTLHLLKTSKSVIFLDPDTCLFHDLSPIWADLAAHDVVLTPHYVTPHPAGDVGMMRFGSFNLGFFAVNRAPEAERFLAWWNERCLDLCYFETQFGLSTDQKWVSIAPCFFPDLYISFNLGYNVAFWNAHERAITPDGNGGYLVNGEFPLIFFHFSSFDEENPELLTKRPFLDKSLKRRDLLELSLAYKTGLDDNTSPLARTPYAYDYMSGGEYISPALRRAYASVLQELPAGHDPFDSNGVVGMFARKNHLLSKKGKYRASGFRDLEGNKTKFVLVNKAMRAILYLLGPNRFMNFSTLLVYLSSYRLNRDLWKL